MVRVGVVVVYLAVYGGWPVAAEFFTTKCEVFSQPKYVPGDNKEKCSYLLQSQSFVILGVLIFELADREFAELGNSLQESCVTPRKSGFRYPSLPNLLTEIEAPPLLPIQR